MLQSLTAERSVATTAVFTNQQTRWVAALALPLVAGPVWCLAWKSFGWQLGTLSGFVLLAALVTSAITDARLHKIYNWVTYSAFLWALGINVAATVLAWGDAAQDAVYRHASVGPELLGGVGLGQSLAGAALCFLVTLFAYNLSGGGAGDVKLAAVIGALLGVHQGLFAVAYTYVIAAAAMIAWTIYRSGPLTVLKAMTRSFGAFLGPLWPFPPSDSDSKIMMKPIPLGPFFAIGTLLVVLEIVPS